MASIVCRKLLIFNLSHLHLRVILFEFHEIFWHQKIRILDTGWESEYKFCCVFQHLSFYRAMHYSAKRGLVCYCLSSVRMPVCLSVCDVGGSGPHMLKILETNCAKISPTSSLFAAKISSTYSQGNMEKFWGD